jgi:hypothetical protein
MELSILFIGDVVGRPGRETLAGVLPELREQYQPDLVLVNAENATHGRGLSPEHYNWFKQIGVDGLTSGDHIWHMRDIFPVLNAPDTILIRPANYGKAPGKGVMDITAKGKRIRIINLMGRVFTSESLDNPFLLFDKLVEEYPKPDAVIVDFHAEATSEKRAFAEYVSGRAQLVVGTHTHVPTADACILNEKTAFISDLGMVGPQDSCLGAEKDEIIQHFLTGLPWRYSVGAGQCQLGAIFSRIDLGESRAIHLEQVSRVYQP